MHLSSPSAEFTLSASTHFGGGVFFSVRRDTYRARGRGGQNGGGCCAPAAGFSYRIVSSCAMVGMPLIAPRWPTQYAPTRLPKARQSASISADCAAMG